MASVLQARDAKARAVQTATTGAELPRTTYILSTDLFSFQLSFFFCLAVLLLLLLLLLLHLVQLLR